MRFPEYGREPRLIIPQSCGGHSEGETPGPIPNPEVKPLSADGTAREASRESRTPPHITYEKSRPRGVGSFRFPGQSPESRSKAAGQGQRRPGRRAGRGGRFLATLLRKVARESPHDPALPSPP